MQSNADYILLSLYFSEKLVKLYIQFIMTKGSLMQGWILAGELAMSPLYPLPKVQVKNPYIHTPYYF